MTNLEQNEMDSGLWFHRMELKEKFADARRTTLRAQPPT